MKPDLVEESKLRWPDGAERTRIRERRSQAAWKKPWSDSKRALALELERLGATSILLTRSPLARSSLPARSAKALMPNS